MPGEPRLSEMLTGTWELLGGSTQTSAGRLVPSTNRAGVVAMVVYDGHGNFSAQFMKRDRGREDVVHEEGDGRAVNNSRTVAGYDAYFGRYIVDDDKGTVTQTLVGALAPENVGQVLTREMSIDGNELTIRVETATNNGEPAVMTLKWKRIG